MGDFSHREGGYKSLSIKDLNKRSEEAKLELRQAKIMQSINEKRQKAMNANSKKLKYEIAVEDLFLSDEIANKTFYSDEERISYYILLLRSENVDVVKYGLFKLQEMLNLEEPKNHEIAKLTGYNILFSLYNQNVFLDFIDCIENNIRDYSVISYILNFFINILYFIENPSTVGKHLVSPKCLGFWEKIFSYNEEELNLLIIWMLSNLATDNENEIINLTNSKLIRETILPYLELYQGGEKDIIERGVTLVSILIEAKNEKNDPVISKVLRRYVKFLCKNSATDNTRILKNVLKGLSRAIEISNEDFFEFIEKSGIIERVLSSDTDETKEDLALKYYGSKLIGNFISVIPQEKVSVSLAKKIYNYTKPRLTDKTDRVRLYAIWTISNTIYESPENIRELMQDRSLFETLVQMPKREGKCDILVEYLYFSQYVFKYCKGSEVFYFGEELSRMISVISGMIIKYEKAIPLLELIVRCLSIAMSRGSLDPNDYSIGSNIIVESFVNCGGKELLERLENCSSREVSDTAAELLSNINRFNI